MYFRGVLSGVFAMLLLAGCVVVTGCGPQKRITVYSIGDSTMADKDTLGSPERGWGMALPELFDTVRVRFENHAVNGRSTKSFIDEGRWDTVLERLKRGDYLLVQFGHNDEKENDTSRYADPWGAYLRTTETMPFYNTKLPFTQLAYSWAGRL